MVVIEVEKTYRFKIESGGNSTFYHDRKTGIMAFLYSECDWEMRFYLKLEPYSDILLTAKVHSITKEPNFNNSVFYHVFVYNDSIKIL